MARKDQFKQSVAERQNRYFSDVFKRNKVDEIDRNISSISEICKEYEVSRTSVQKWIYKYSNMRKRGVKQVIEARSDTRKLLEMKEKIQELERVIGQKQLLIDFQEKVIEIAEQEYKIDIKKKFGVKDSSGSGITNKSIITR